MTFSAKITPTPILVTDVCRMIRQHNGEIWCVSRAEYGTTIRASLNDHSLYVRAIVPSLTADQAVEIPLEGKLPSHVVRTLTEFDVWLCALAGKETGKQ